MKIVIIELIHKDPTKIATILNAILFHQLQDLALTVKIHMTDVEGKE